MVFCDGKFIKKILSCLRQPKTPKNKIKKLVNYTINRELIIRAIFRGHAEFFYRVVSKNS